jgi:hypothetical protein
MIINIGGSNFFVGQSKTKKNKVAINTTLSYLVEYSKEPFLHKDQKRKINKHFHKVPRKYYIPCTITGIVLSNLQLKNCNYVLYLRCYTSLSLQLPLPLSSFFFFNVTSSHTYQIFFSCTLNFKTSNNPSRKEGYIKPKPLP